MVALNKTLRSGILKRISVIVVISLIPVLVKVGAK